MKVQCPHCKASFNAPDEYKGKKGECPKCKEQFIISELLSESDNSGIYEKENNVAFKVCANCERTIGKLEQTYNHKGKVVCKECKQRLDAPINTTTTKNVKRKQKTTPAAWLVLGLFIFIMMCSVWGGNGEDEDSTYVQTNYSKDYTGTRSSPAPIYKMGEQFLVGYMSYVIDTAEWADKISRSYGDIKPDSSFLIINLRVRNDDNKARQIPPFHLLDEDGKEYDTSSKSSYLDCDFNFLHQLNPEVSTEGCIVFDTPRNHQYWLKISGEYWSTKDALVTIITSN